MHRDKNLHPYKSVPPLPDPMGNIPVASASHAILPPSAKLFPFHGIEFQPSEACPRNFIIFDQTDRRSQIMYNPVTAHKFNGPGLNFGSTYLSNDFARGNMNNVQLGIPSSPMKEDTNDIDALLSLDDDEEDDDGEGEEEEEVSTARTYGNYRSNSPDSCSSYRSNLKKSKCGSGCSGSSCNSERKRKMKKMVKVLRGMLPGSEEMNTVAVLDEAVKYLKSLKGEVQRLNVGNFDN